MGMVARWEIFVRLGHVFLKITEVICKETNEVAVDDIVIPTSCFQWGFEIGIIIKINCFFLSYVDIIVD